MKEYVYVFWNNRYDKYNFIYRDKTFQPAKPEQIVGPGIYEVKNVTYENEAKKFGYANIHYVPVEQLSRAVEFKVENLELEGFPKDCVTFKDGDFDNKYEIDVIFKTHLSQTRYIPAIVLKFYDGIEDGITTVLVLFTEEDGTERWHPIYSMKWESPIYKWSSFYVPKYSDGGYAYKGIERDIRLKITDYLEKKAVKGIFDPIKAYDDEIVDNLVTAVKPQIWSDEKYNIPFYVLVLKSGAILLTYKRGGCDCRILYQIKENSEGWLELEKITEQDPLINTYLHTAEVKRKIEGKDIIKTCRERKILFCGDSESAYKRRCDFIENPELIYTYENGEEISNLLKDLDLVNNIRGYLAIADINVFLNGKAKKWLALGFSPVAYANMTEKTRKTLDPIVDKACENLFNIGRNLAKHGAPVDECRRFSPNFYLPYLCM